MNTHGTPTSGPGRPSDSGRPASSGDPRLVLESIGERAWRLCDAGVEPDDVERLVAYVEQTRGDVYEVVWIADGLHPSRHESLGAVIEAAQIARERRVVPRSTKPVPIPHHAPPTPRGETR